MKFSLFVSMFLILGCSSSLKNTVLDTSSTKRPKWADKSEISWEKDKSVYFKGGYTVRGDQRANACIDLAKLDVKEALITEIQEELKGAIDNASDSIDVNAEIILNKSRSSEYRGTISGLRFTGRYWEKYALADNEQKISCYVLGSIKTKDYMKTKKQIVNKITKANPELKEAVRKKQVNFFEKKEEGSKRKTASQEE